MIDAYVMQGIFLMICWVEVMLCFGLLDIFLGIRCSLGRAKKVSIIVFVLGIGCLFATNRQILFFSHNMWFLSMLFTSIFAMVIIKKQLFLVAEIIIIYYSLMALIDFAIAFFALNILKESFEEIVFEWTLSWWSILIFSVARILMLVMMRFMRKMWTEEIDTAILKKTLLPISAVVCILVRYFQNVLVALVRKELDMIPWGVGFALLACLVLFVVAFIFFQRNTILQSQNQILRVRDDFQTKYYLEIEQQSEENRRIIHDVKNHVVTLQGLCEKEDVSAVRTYLQEMNGMFESVSEKVWCNNRVVNVILNQKLKEAAASNIQMHIQSVPHVMVPISDREMVTIFGNLLDNAIEACRKVTDGERQIFVSMKQKQHYFYLEITNTIHEKPVVRNNTIISSKQDAKKHGYGLKNVKHVVDKYKGIMSIDVKENTFCVRISLFL